MLNMVIVEAIQYGNALSPIFTEIIIYTISILTEAKNFVSHLFRTFHIATVTLGSKDDKGWVLTHAITLCDYY